jgi:hypothetical protein
MSEMKGRGVPDRQILKVSTRVHNSFAFWGIKGLLWGGVLFTPPYCQWKNGDFLMETSGSFEHLFS